MNIPHSPLLLGLAGLVPFIWGALTVLSPDLGDWSVRTLGPRFTGTHVALFYGAIILAFMSGVLWGFATQARGTAGNMGYVLSVIPALWAFFMTGGGVTSTATSLIAGFVAILGIDWFFWRINAAPDWWLRLRILLTAIVVACLATVALT